MPESEKRLKLISTALARDFGSDKSLVVRVVSTWTGLADQLIPLIGERAFCTLYARALHIVIPEYKWLHPVACPTAVESLFQILGKNLEATDSRIAASASSRLLETFATLLSNIVGDALTAQVLNTAWIESGSGDSSLGKIK